MGAWGTAIFSDDTAADVRDDFRRLIGDGLSPEDATARLLDEYRSSLEDPAEGPSFWLGLAVAQWKLGRLQPSILARALDIIDSGADLARWSGNAKLVRARAVVLAKSRALLLSSPPASRRVARAFRQTTDWEIGDLVSYRLASGKHVVLRVLGHHVDKGGTAPEMDLLEYYGDSPPDPSRAAACAPRPMVEKLAHSYDLVHRFMVGAASPRDMPPGRAVRLGVRVPINSEPAHMGKRVLTWRPGQPLSLDAFVERVMSRPVAWHPGPGGEDHWRWLTGEVLAHRTDAGRYAFLQVVDRYHGHGIDGAPIVAALHTFPDACPTLADVPARAIPVIRSIGSHLGFVLVNDSTDAVARSALIPLGLRAPVGDRLVPVFASMPMALWRIERAMRANQA